MRSGHGAATLDPPQMAHMRPWGESYWIAPSEVAGSVSGIVRPSDGLCVRQEARASLYQGGDAAS